MNLISCLLVLGMQFILVSLINFSNLFPPLIMIEYIEKLPWMVVIVFCLTLGLAPFFPPHLFEKIQMLFNGELKRLIDWFDLLLHGAPWILLIVKAVITLKTST